MNFTDAVKDFFDPKEQDLSDEKGRFVLTSRQALGGMMLYTITDRETGVSYLTKSGIDCPLTPLLDADGTPLIARKITVKQCG